MDGIANKIQAVIDLNGISHAELSRRSGVPQARISEIVNGKTRNPQLKTLQKLASALGCDMSFSLPTVAEPSPGYSPADLPTDERDLLRRWRLLSPRHKENILEMLAAYGALSEGTGEQSTAVGGSNQPR